MASDPRARFAATADDYDAARPGYPHALREWVLGRLPAPPATVLDVGCGTGIASRLFAVGGSRVVGVDPSLPMLAKAVRRGGGPAYAGGEVAALPVAGGAVDLVTCAQAFHWFDRDRALAEFRRVLRPGGACAAFWNRRAATPFNEAYERLLRRASREYGVVPDTAEGLAAVRTAAGLSALDERCFPNVQWLDAAGLHARAWSSSYVAHGVDDPEAFDAALDALFVEHARGGRLAVVYETVALSWGFAG